MENDNAFLIGFVLIHGDGLRILHQALRDGNQQFFHFAPNLSGREFPPIQRPLMEKTSPPRCNRLSEKPSHQPQTQAFSTPAFFSSARTVSVG